MNWGKRVDKIGILETLLVEGGGRRNKQEEEMGARNEETRREEVQKGFRARMARVSEKQ